MNHGFFQRLVSRPAFQQVVLALISANAVLIGFETSQAVMAAYGGWLHVLNWVFQAAFVIEIACRLAALGRRWPRFFLDGWNTFDFVVVAASLIPAAGPTATVARLARVLRALRLVSVFPELRLIVSTMVRSLPSMGHVILLLSLLLYIYGVVGYHLFHAVDPARWGSLGRALLTLFEIVTLEGWVDIQSTSMAAHPWAWLYYVSFITIAVFVVINLFIAVVINNLEAAKQDEQKRGGVPGAPDVARRIADIRAQLDDLARELEGKAGA